MALARSLMIRTRINATLPHLKRAGSPGMRPSPFIATYLGLTLAGIAASGQDAPKEAEKANLGRLLVLIDRPSINPAEKQIRGFLIAEPGSNQWHQVGDPDLVEGSLSSDRRFLAAGRPAIAGQERVGVWVYDLVENSPARRVFDRPFFSCSWANDGKQLVVSTPAAPGVLKFETYRLNADGSERIRLPIPETEVVMDCSPDGSWLASFVISADPPPRARINVMRPDGTESHTILDEPGGVARDFRFSPDGRKVVYSLSTGERRKERTTVWVVDRDGRNRTQVAVELELGTRCRPFWSPDGKRLALNLSTGGVIGGGRIVVVDLDGKNLVTLPPAPWGIRLYDWR
jgi:WD40-like Beta Propeller Repeat